MTWVAAGAVLLLLVVGLAGWLWYAMGRPLYEPGMVRSGTNLSGPLDPPTQPADGPFWQVEPDVRLFHHARGTGRPVLVVHGGPGYPIREPLAGLAPLAAEYEFHYYDQRGCGRSTRPFDRFASGSFYANMTALERKLGVGAQVADVERIRRILGRERITLLGHSFGAFLATMYAAEFPERVEALILVAPAGVLVLPDEGGDYFAAVRSRLPADRLAEYDGFVRDYLDFGSLFSKSEAELAALNRKVGDYFLEAGGKPDGTSPPADNGGWMVQAAYLSLGKRHDYRTALRAVPTPALIVHGGDDLLPDRAARQYADLLPNARLHVLSGGAGHFLLSDPSGQLARVASAFLKSARP